MPLAAANLRAIILDCDTCGVLAQLVERLNGIEEVRGSNPLGSTTLVVEFCAAKDSNSATASSAGKNPSGNPQDQLPVDSRLCYRDSLNEM